MRYTGVIAAMLVCGLAVAANAQEVKKNTISGKIVSNSILVPASSAAAVLTVPPASAGVFILTETCTPTTLSTTSYAQISTDGNCKAYTPGLVIPADDVITCTNTYVGPQPCTVTGVLSKK